MSDNKGFNIIFDEKVIQAAIAGDEVSFEKIYDQYYPASLALAYRITGNSDLAQDITQESFFNLFNNIKKYRGDGSFSGWVRRIVCNQSINHLNKNNRIITVQEDVIYNLESNDLFDTNWCNASADLDKLVKTLSYESRAVLILHEVEGFTHKEIAKLFNKTESFSKSLLSRTFLLLKERIVKMDKANINLPARKEA